jgi:anthranilate synthase component I
MQIIDELEVNQRGPYGGGYGHVSFSGAMDMALALRTMVIPTNVDEHMYDYSSVDPCSFMPRQEWKVNIQAGAGIVADSNPEMEYQECVNKSNALSRAIDLAEATFVQKQGGVERAIAT